MKNIVLMSALIVSLLLTSCHKKDRVIIPTTFKVIIENIFTPKSYQVSGTFDAIPPGTSQSFSFNAGKGSYLSFATMFVKSNDLFYGFADTGLALYDANGNAKTGDFTMDLFLWDAGTEVNEMPGTGPNQPMNQSGPNTGVDENGVIHINNDSFTYPSINNVISINIAFDGGTLFTITINNISDMSSLPTPLAPGVWAVHNNQVKLFNAGETASAGIESLAEDGNNSTLNDFLVNNSGYFSPLAPGVYAIHRKGVNPIFRDMVGDNGQGLEALAEDGDPSMLGASLSSFSDVIKSGIFNTPAGSANAGPLLPSNTYSFTFSADPGDYLSIATMLVQSNDLFYAFDDTGIALFNGEIPISGDVTSAIKLWDTGTEVNEFPGAGNNQPARGGANSGLDENGVVQVVNDSFTYPPVADAIKVTIELQ